MSEGPGKRILPPQVLLGAYSQGVFPMADRGEIVWFSPLQRGLMPLDERFHVPHGLKRALKRRPFELRWNTAFRSVMEGCADREETWIDEVILESYCLLHELGFAHSVECWDEDGLQGGLYGVALGRVFFGESMFTRRSDASKIALVGLARTLRAASFELLDIQWKTKHLECFGAYEVSREEYHVRLAEALRGFDAGAVNPPRLEDYSSSPYSPE
jgi:leucyl/phenylalanyl-tRNA--protein transferase